MAVEGRISNALEYQTMTIRYGDVIEALPGTPTSWIAEGRLGVVVATGPSEDRGGWLVRWGDDTVLFGFHPEYVRVVREEA